MNIKKGILPLASLLVLSASALQANAEVAAYWQDQNGAYVRSGTGGCVRTNAWTPERAVAECDPQLVASQTAAATPANTSTDYQQQTRVNAPAAVVVEKTIVTPETLFDSNQAEIKPSGKATLDELIVTLQGNNSVIIPIGYTAGPDSPDSNAQLSERRAEAVKDYLVSQGIDSNRIYIASREEPASSAYSSSAASSDNRRVEIEVKAVPPLD
ncbi:MAG: OmpA family protein [Gammaproteobacteria bacterium]|nr:OmpA family protein [Gammaproteobacteria bacterium]